MREIKPLRTTFLIVFVAHFLVSVARQVSTHVDNNYRIYAAHVVLSEVVGWLSLYGGLFAAYIFCDSIVYTGGKNERDE